MVCFKMRARRNYLSLVSATLCLCATLGLATEVSYTTQARLEQDKIGGWEVCAGDGFRVRTRRTDPAVCSGVEGVSGYVVWGA